MTNRKATVTFFLVLLFSITSFAGGIIKIKSTKTDGGEVSENIIYVQNGKMRTEATDNGEKSIIILDTQKGELIVITPSDESYVVITEEDFKNFVQLINNQKEAMLKQLPEDQREAMSKMFDQQMAEMKNKPKIEYKKVGSDNFNGYDCEIYNVFKNGEKVEESWITSWGNMKLKDEYVKVFKGMESFFKKMADNMGEFGNMMENDFDSEMFDKGFPVKTIEYKDGNPVSIETIEEVSEKDLPSSLFEAPKNMRKENPFKGM